MVNIALFFIFYLLFTYPAVSPRWLYLLSFTLLNLARQQINYCHSYGYSIFYLL